MASSTITWVAATGQNSLSQTVQYKLKSASTWTTFSTIGQGIETVTITGLLENTQYQFRIVDNCAVGGAVPSAPTDGIKFVCPELVIEPTYDSVAISFDNLHADITKYVVQLLDASGSSVLGTTSITDVSPATLTTSFTGLAGSTTYKVRITMYVGVDFLVNNICTAISFTTGVTPACIMPSGVSATMS